VPTNFKQFGEQIRSTQKHRADVFTLAGKSLRHRRLWRLLVILILMRGIVSPVFAQSAGSYDQKRCRQDERPKISGARISHALMNLYQPRPRSLHLYDDHPAMRLTAVRFVPWSSTTERFRCFFSSAVACSFAASHLPLLGNGQTTNTERPT